MYIGEVSKRTGLSIRAIRFYEQIGLINAPRRQGKYRVYQESDVDMFILIKEATELGISLSSLKGVIVYQDGKVNWSEIHGFLLKFRDELVESIKDLNLKLNSVDRCCAQIKL